LEAKAQDATNTITRASNEAAATKTNAAFEFVGTGLQIGSDYYYKTEKLERLKNRDRS
jgi:hypothetical protein